MAPVLFAAAICLLALPGATRRFGRRLDPAEWSRFCTAALVTGAIMLEFSVTLYAAPTVLRAARVPHLADLCERVLGAVLPGDAVLGWPAAGIALTFPLLSGFGARRARKAQALVQVEPCVGVHRPVDGYELVVLPTPQVLAFSVQAPVAQVVISEGLIAALPPDEVDAVVRHEVAHLHHRHSRLLLLASALERGLPLGPLVRRSTAALRIGLERWADEAAAAEGRTSRAVLHRALLGVCAAMVHPAVAAFSAADTVAERLDALRSGPPRPSGVHRAAAYAPAVIVTAAVTAAFGFWGGELTHLLALARHHCPN